MQPKKKEKKGKKDKKKLVFFSVLFLVWFGLSQADFSGPNVFQDRDGDGLTDQEELAFGTNPNVSDSDGDGYSDGVEVRSGYDPLKPSPGDQIVISSEVSVAGTETEKEEKINLTDQYLAELATEKGDYLNALKLAAEGDKDTIEKNNLGQLSLTEGDLSAVLEKVSQQAQLSEEEIAPIEESEIIILPSPKGTAEEIKEQEKKQVETYMTTLGYLVVTRAPFEVSDQDELLNSGEMFVQQTIEALMIGDFKRLQELRDLNEEVFNELKKTPVPEVIKDFHLKALYLYRYFLEGVDEKTLVNQTDPIAMMLSLGKVQALAVKAQELSEQLDQIFTEYGIESWTGEGIF